MQQLLAYKISEVPLGGGGTLGNKYPTISTLISLILKNSLTVVGVLFLVLLIFGGILYIIGAGSDDPKKAQQAQGIIKNAVIGFFVVFFAYFIIQIIQVITGLEILNPIL